MTSWYAEDSSRGEERLICSAGYLSSVADGIEEEKTLDSLGMCAGVRQRHATAHAVSHECEAIETERIDDCADIRGERGDGVLRFLGGSERAVAAEVEGHRPP